MSSADKIDRGAYCISCVQQPFNQLSSSFSRDAEVLQLWQHHRLDLLPAVVTCACCSNFRTCGLFLSLEPAAYNTQECMAQSRAHQAIKVGVEVELPLVLNCRRHAGH